MTLSSGRVIAGEPLREESYHPTIAQLGNLGAAAREKIIDNNGFASRTLYRIGNYDFYANDFEWVSEFDIV